MFKFSGYINTYILDQFDTWNAIIKLNVS